MYYSLRENFGLTKKKLQTYPTYGEKQGQYYVTGKKTILLCH